MKARNKLLIIFFTSIVVLLVTSFILLSVIRKKNELLLDQGYKELLKETNKAISIESIGLENWVYDNSFWDELVRSFKQSDTSWVYDNVASNMNKFGSDYLWMVYPNGKLMYGSRETHDSSGVSEFFMDSKILTDTLQKHPFAYFYTFYKNELIKVYAAPVQMTADTARSSTPYGYYIAAMRINDAYLESLSKLTEQNQYRLITSDSANFNESGRHSTIVNHYLPLRDFYGKPIQTLRISKNLTVLDSYQKDLELYLFIFMGIILLIAAILFYFFKTSVTEPLYILSQALATRSSNYLQKLEHESNEFGELAMMISVFFQQNKQLKEEAEQRHKSQIALQKAAQELEQATIERIRAEQAHLAKTDFLSTMSHEIRTPINGVIGVCNLLMEEKLTEVQQQYVGILNFSSRHLLSIVSDILDFSKIESGNMQFDKSSFDLRKTCRNIIELFEVRANEKNLSLSFEPDPDVVLSLYGDCVRLCQVLTNLIGNAIKFTEKGSVKLSYRSISETQSHTTMAFSVLDTGIGISRDKIGKIFESFTQADQSISSNYGGTGLGLTISKKLIELQGGKIDVKSEPGKGSEFVFYLTFEKHVYVDSLPTPASSVGRTKNLQGMRIMIVEDNRINAQVLSGFLKKWEVQYVLANNGQEAIDKLAEYPFDAVLMDLQMPVMDGKEATRIIRGQRQTAYCDIPIIALTADATSETQSTIDQFGFSQYLSKPFNPDSLYRLLKKYYSIYEN
jgi:signal transduction histidine kinase/CheY-like chemotaxis protein